MKNELKVGNKYTCIKGRGLCTSDNSLCSFAKYIFIGIEDSVYVFLFHDGKKHYLTASEVLIHFGIDTQYFTTEQPEGWESITIKEPDMTWSDVINSLVSVPNYTVKSVKVEVKDGIITIGEISQSTVENSELTALQSRVQELEGSTMELIDERDHLEDALNKIMGILQIDKEWSNHYNIENFVDDVLETVNEKDQQINQLTAEVERLRGAVEVANKKFTEIIMWKEGSEPIEIAAEAKALIEELTTNKTDK